MVKDEIIDSIVKQCNFEIINNIFDIIFLFQDDNVSTNTFMKYKKKYNITSYELAKYFCKFNENRDFENEYNQIKHIGKSYTKQNKNGKKKSYKRKFTYPQRNPETRELENNSLTHLDILRKRIKEKEDSFNSPFTLTKPKELNKIISIIDFINIHVGTNYDMLCLTDKDGKNSAKNMKNMLSKCSSEDLTDLLYSLETGNYVNYIDEPEYDPYDCFIDDTDINTLYFVYENIDIIEKNIVILSLFFDNVMQCHSDEEIEVLNIELRKRKSVRHDDDNIRELINIRYGDNVVIDDEKDFRDYIFRNKFSKVDDYTSDRIIYIFKNMTSIKWDFTAQVFDKFAKPAGKIAIDYFDKIIQ